MKTTLLVGSGVSYYSGLPGINAITELILNGDEASLHTDENYYLKAYSGVFNENICFKNYKPYKVLHFIYNSTLEFYNYFSSNHRVNYEDIFFVAKQIQDSCLFEYENPGVFELIKSITKEFDLKKDELYNIVKHITRYITCCTWQLIDKKICNVSQYEIIFPMLEELNLQSVISLNHDTILETFLTKKKISYCDGFEQEHSLSKWVGFEPLKADLKVCKLHGSVDWYEFQFTDKNPETVLLKLPYGQYSEYKEEFNGRPIRPNLNHPAIMIGTFNKIWHYNSGLFETLFNEFRSTLECTSHLIVSGYGFGDKGINSQIVKWLNMEDSKKLLIVTPSKADLTTNARGAFILGISNHPKTNYIECNFEHLVFDNIYKKVK